MVKSSRELAIALLNDGPGGREAVRVHELEDDESAHDNDRIEELYREFGKDFDRVQMELSREYGQPSRTGIGDDDDIPLNGVFRYAIWNVGQLMLYVGAAHEDRGAPILLMVGIADHFQAKRN